MIEAVDINNYRNADKFVGWGSEDGLLKVIAIYGKQQRKTTFKVVCEVCSKDTELFPDGYFVSLKSSLKRGQKPCGCSKKPEWEGWQYLILARRAGEGKFIVHGFSEEFKNQTTKLNLECLASGHKWSASVTNIINGGRGCPHCSKKYTPTELEALDKCKIVCNEMDYKLVGFVDGYKGALKTQFEYLCPKHELQRVSYNNFINNGTRCKLCAKENRIKRLQESGNGNGYYPERKDETDFLYILNFDDQYIKVGRSFDVDDRIKDGLIYESGLRDINKIHKLRIFTATHQEIYDYEQELHSELRCRGFQYYVDWSTECFNIGSLPILNTILDGCLIEEVII